MTVRLHLAGVTKVFAGTAALDAVSFDLEVGSALGVLGPNGCGRTVLIDIISGLLAPDRGQMTLAEASGSRIDLIGLPPQNIVELGIARTWQDIQLIGGMTVLDEVMLGGFSRRRSGLLSTAFGLPAARRDIGRARNRARQMLAVVGLGERAPSLADRLTRYEQMRVGIARALTSEPEILLLDAPAAGLSEAELADLGGLIEILREAGISILVADRSMKLIAQCCDRAIALDAGRLIATGSPSECFAAPAVQQAYFGAATAAAC